MKVSEGTVVSLHYALKDDKGTVIESTEGRDPLTYLHGYNNIIPGLERELEGSEAGSTADVTVEPDDAYGERNEDAVFEVPKEEFPEGFDPHPGMPVQAQTPEGVVQLTVADVKDEAVVLDGNHPLAGMTLNFALEVADVREATEEEKENGQPGA